jgi:thioester reductase-like protein
MLAATISLLALLPNALPQKSLLLTGATGFVGKVLLERLLEDTDIESVYLLVRPKKGASASRRLEALQQSAALTHKSLARVKVVEGDLSSPLLGLEVRSRAALLAGTTHIIHLAASVDFDLPLARAVEANVGGALGVLEFARACPNLSALVHCSTAYVSTARADDHPLLEDDVPSLESSIGIDAAAVLERIRAGGVSQQTALQWLRTSGHPNS